jgi:hypothetical protein
MKKIVFPVLPQSVQSFGKFGRSTFFSTACGSQCHCIESPQTILADPSDNNKFFQWHELVKRISHLLVVASSEEVRRMINRLFLRSAVVCKVWRR